MRLKIRGLLLIGSGITIILVFVFSLMVYVGFNKVAEENERELLAHEVHQTISELDIITYEYLTHREERMVIQWYSRYESTAEIIERLDAKEEWDITKGNFTDLINLFSKIAVNYEKQNSAELEERLVAQFLIKSQTIISDSSKIAEDAYDNAIEAQKEANNSMMIAVAILSVSLIGISFYVAGRITKPLDELKKGADIVGKGDLGHRIDIKSKNEIGQLAEAFNEMANKLRGSYSSLEEKVRQRTEELEKAKVSLEVKVKERTKELEEAKASLEQQVAQRTEELKEKLDVLEQFRTATEGREFEMIKLKQRIEKLETARV